MALIPCSYCDRVPRHSHVVRIWAWHPEGRRIAYKTRACQECNPEAENILGGPVPSEGEYIQLPASCPVCSDPLGKGETVLTYMTVFENGSSRSEVFAACDRCSAPVHAELATRGEYMTDRDLTSRRRAA